MDDLIEIQYVGRKPRKKDTVAGTGIIWHGRGDVQLVPRAVAQRLCDYPDIWRRTLPMARGSGTAGLMGVEPSGGEPYPQGPSLPGVVEGDGDGDQTTEVDGGGVVEGDVASGAEAAPGAPGGEGDGGEGENSVPTPLHARLVDVIRSLPPEGFTEAGRPRKSTVVAILGEDVSVADIAAAWDDVQRETSPQAEAE